MPITGLVICKLCYGRSGGRRQILAVGGYGGAHGDSPWFNVLHFGDSSSHTP